MNSCIWAASSSCLLWKMLQRTLLGNYRFKILLSIFFSINPDAGELNHVIFLFIAFWGITVPFSIVSAPILYSHQQCQRDSISPHCHQHFMFSGEFLFIFDSGHYNECKVVTHSRFDLPSQFSVVSDRKHLFIFLLSTCMSSLVNCLARHFAHLYWFFLSFLFFFFLVIIFEL